MTLTESTTDHAGVSRRRILQGAAWATPAVLVAMSTPAAAVSVDSFGLVPGTNEYAGAWLFLYDRFDFSDGKYDLKTRYVRNSESPGYQQLMNSGHQGPVTVTMALTLDLTLLGSSGAFWAINPAVDAVTNGVKSLDAKWVVAGGMATSATSYTFLVMRDWANGEINAGQFAPQNFQITIPTVSKDNGRNVAGPLQVTYSARTFITRDEQFVPQDNRARRP